MLTALSIAMLTAITVWWLLVRRLREKPWLQQGVLPASQDTVTSSAPRVGLWVFLAMVTSLFGIFASAYMMRVGHAHGEIQPWLALNEPRILWVNTVLLVLASAALQIARTRADSGDLNGLRAYFTAGGLLTVLFLAGQIWAWELLNASGEYDRRHPAYTFFILLTAVHGLHMLGGMFVLTRTAARVWRGIDAANVVAISRLRLSVQLTTVYWHWLLLIWLGVFALLLTT
jgi:cytochrome c oxidase subunit 3